jgi:hypothetical protein
MSSGQICAHSVMDIMTRAIRCRRLAPGLVWHDHSLFPDAGGRYLYSLRAAWIDPDQKLPRAQLSMHR